MHFTIETIIISSSLVSHCGQHHHQTSNVLTGHWADFLDHVKVESRSSGLYDALETLADAKQQWLILTAVADQHDILMHTRDNIKVGSELLDE